MTGAESQARPLGWTWAARCRLLGGHPSRELFDEALAAGDAAVPFLVELATTRGFREGDPPECAELVVHALRLLAELRAPGALPALLGVLTDPVDPVRFSDEAARALARLGSPAVPALEALLAARDRDTWVRVGAARALLFTALCDRRLRARTVASYERLFRDPQERDTLLVAQVASSAGSLGAIALMPALAAAFAAGRIDESIIEPRGLQMLFELRRHRLDPVERDFARRDLRSEAPPWAELAAELEPGVVARLEALSSRALREGAGPPDPVADLALFGLEPGEADID